MQEYNITFNACAPAEFPAESVYCLLWYNAEEAIEAMPKYPYANGWGGKTKSNALRLRSAYPMPFKFSVCYLSIAERQFYELEVDLSADELERLWIIDDKETYSGFNAGLGPGGVVNLWLTHDRKSSLVGTWQAHTSSVTLADYLPFYNGETIESYCKKYKVPLSDKNDILADRLRFFKKLNRQFNYRYKVFTGSSKEKKWTDSFCLSETESKVKLFDCLTDGSFSQIADSAIFKYHSGGKPEKIAIKITEGKTEYNCYFWFDRDSLSKIFEHFYGAHSQTKADLLFRMDPENKVFEIGLFRQGMKEPLIIPELSYQTIVFKNKFEDCRSDNFNRPDGAWNW